MTRQYRKYTDEDFIEAVRTSYSIRQVLSKIGLIEAGGNYSSCRKLIETLNLDTSHFHGMLWSKGKTLTPKRPIEDYLSNKQSIKSYNLKRRILKENIFEHKCMSCNLSVWMGEQIPLELHHKNGNHLDNSLENLQLLCPNCHAQTDTHKGKNQSRHKQKSQ